MAAGEMSQYDGTGDRLLTPCDCDLFMITPLKHHPSRKKCLSCQGPLSVHQEVGGGVCDDPRCRTALVHLSERRASQHRAEVAKTLRTSPEDLPFSVVPCIDGGVSNLPEKRRRRFRDHLNEAIGLAVAWPHIAPNELSRQEYPKEIDPTPAEQAKLDKVCGTCRGYCCTHGSDHAFLNVLTIRSFIAGHPEIRPRQVLGAYLDRLPNRSCRGSCVYHTATGCVLPRAMRATICNNFYCDGQQKLFRLLVEPQTPRLLAVCVRNNTVVRSVVVDSIPVDKPSPPRPTIQDC